MSLVNNGLMPLRLDTAVAMRADQSAVYHERHSFREGNANRDADAGNNCRWPDAEMIRHQHDDLFSGAEAAAYDAKGADPKSSSDAQPQDRQQVRIANNCGRSNEAPD